MKRATSNNKISSISLNSKLNTVPLSSNAKEKPAKTGERV